MGTRVLKQFLAEPDKHWRTDNAAKSLAHCWEESGDTPHEAKAVLARAPELAGIETLFCMPEHQVPLAGGSRPSQNDVWVLGRAPQGLASLAVAARRRPAAHHHTAERATRFGVCTRSFARAKASTTEEPDARKPRVRVCGGGSG
ncbi:DUF6946 family protein [Thiohalocapsa halophila]|uniref:DUF6946 family protein n=1 Tax=Thiohalocapsa halophila TaxID=69359 RepID=UPI003F6916E5